MSTPKNKLQVWFPLLFSIVLIAGMVIGYKLRENSGIKDFFTTRRQSSMQEVLDLIRGFYVDDVKTDSLGASAINDLLHQLDPHSVYIPASDIDYVNADLRGNFSGIGVEFQMFYDTVNVLNVLPGGPSEKAGLQVGDKFIKVNDSVTIAGKGLKPDDIRHLLRGDKGSPVKLSILRDKQSMSITITRGNVDIPTVDAAYMITPETGFIHLTKFGETSYIEFMQAMERLKAKQMKNLILDLRGNPGGLLDQAVNMADEFLDEDKLIVYTEGSHVARSEYKCKRPGVFETGKLTLLMDEGSASASEVLSGALQDWDRATIVGRRSFGKGLVQEQFSLSDGSALRLTVARYFTPLGRNIQKPYAEGYDKYEEEVSNRFHNGEVLKGDTTKKAGKAYTTPKGRVVYGGGGITPDVYVPFDTTSPGTTALKLYASETLSNFVYSYYVQQRNLFSQYKNSEALAAGFKAGEPEWNALKTFAQRDSINLDSVTDKEKTTILNRLPRMFARQIWRSSGYYEVANKTDNFVQKALEMMK